VPDVLAVDFGGTKTTIALIDDRGAIRERVKMPAARTVAESVEQVARTIEQRGAPSAAGVIVPGIFSPATGRAWCPNLWGPDEVPLADLLHAECRMPTVVDSDRSGYVLGESWLGVARGFRDVVFLAIGTGIGAGILSGGRLLAGAHGIAGAAGWFALTTDWNSAYAQGGCWESEAAGPAIARQFGVADAEVVVRAAREGDSRAQAVLTRTARFIGMGVANLISVLNPEMVVLGGGILQGAGDLLLDQVRAEAGRWAQRSARMPACSALRASR
jgi:glucokinase